MPYGVPGETGQDPNQLATSASSAPFPLPVSCLPLRSKSQPAGMRRKLALEMTPSSSPPLVRSSSRPTSSLAIVAHVDHECGVAYHRSLGRTARALVLLQGRPALLASGDAGSQRTR